MKKRHHLTLALAVALGSLGVCTSANPRILNKAQGAPDLQAEHWYSIKALGEGEGEASQPSAMQGVAAGRTVFDKATHRVGVQHGLEMLLGE